MPRSQSKIQNRKSKILDVLALGAIAVDDLLFVESYPPADVKVPVLRRERHIGGMAAGALIAAARLGCRCAYAGILGEDEPSRFIADRLRAEGIDLSHAVRRREASPIHSTVIVDTTHRTRNIFHHRGPHVGADAKRPPRGVIASARVLLLDHLGMPGMLRAAKVAKTAGVATVSDIDRDTAPEFRELFELVDHAIVSQAFAQKLTGLGDPARAAEKLSTGRAAAVVTCGEKGAWFALNAKKALRQPSFKTKVVDTTGCGDVFHGAYAAALAQGHDPGTCVKWGAAAAALKASGAGHSRTPDFEQLARLVEAR